MKEFSKSYLRDGDRLTTKNRDVIYYHDEWDVYVTEDFIYDKDGEDESDIVKVERIQFKEEYNESLKMYFHNEVYVREFDIDENLTYQTIWEREESSLPKQIQDINFSKIDFSKYEPQITELREQTKKVIETISVAEQPKKIEPLPVREQTMYDGKILPFSDTMVMKLNELIEVINKEVIDVKD